jgi:hypothetical protein
MNTIFRILIFTFCFCNFISAQNSLVKKWDKRLGGTDWDYVVSLQQTRDDGFILYGYSVSGAGGDKSQNSRGMTDVWIVKTDSLGNKLWDKSFGGSDDDIIFSIQQTLDGGYILPCYSKSNISGDKTQANWGGWDFWIIKIDSLGNKLWDKDYGANGDEQLASIDQTSDGGFILGGSSNSGISGNKTEDTNGNIDFWIVKIDSLGNKQWDKDYGGISSDNATSIRQTSDKGYLIGGYSNSNISGDKTQDSFGGMDYWIIKTDSTGNIMWDKIFGGTDHDYFYSLQISSDGGYVFGGLSRSTISGNKTTSTWGDDDYWIVKTDSLGNILWDKDYGGNIGDAEFGKIASTSKGGYLIAGDSYSPASGNKSENNMGLEQSWVLKLDSLGNLLWEKTILTQGHDERGSAIETTDGCIVVTNICNAGIGGYKSQASWNYSFDFWLVKFCESLQAGFTSSTNLLCPGTCIDFINLSVQASSYQWSFPGATTTSSTAANPSNICYPNPGTFDVTLISTNAISSDTLTFTNYITVYPIPPAQSITQSNDTLFSLTGYYFYQWYFNGNIINDATSYLYVATQSGNYSIVATDSNGCEVEAVMNNVIAGNQLAAGNGQLVIFPNPVSETLDIHGLDLNLNHEISIFNLVGEKVFSAVNCKLPIANCEFSSGMYYIEITSDKKIFRMKFLKE